MDICLVTIDDINSRTYKICNYNIFQAIRNKKYEQYLDYIIHNNIDFDINTFLYELDRNPTRCAKIYCPPIIENNKQIVFDRELYNVIRYISLHPEHNLVESYLLDKVSPNGIF